MVLALGANTIYGSVLSADEKTLPSEDDAKRNPQSSASVVLFIIAARCTFDFRVRTAGVSVSQV